MKTPECDKMVAVKDASRHISEFLEWLGSENIVLCKWYDEGEDDSNKGFYPLCRGNQYIVADFFKVDLKKVEEERRAILDEFRKQS